MLHHTTHLTHFYFRKYNSFALNVVQFVQSRNAAEVVATWQWGLEGAKPRE